MTPEEIAILKNKHHTELSALNAIVKLFHADPATVTAIDLLVNNSEQTRTPGVVRSNASGTIALECFSFSVANCGAADGIILGTTIKSGEVLNFSAGVLGNKFGANTITYNGTGTDLLITYIY